MFTTLKHLFDDNDESLLEKVIPFMPTPIGSIIHDVIDRTKAVSTLSEDYVNAVTDTIIGKHTVSKHTVGKR
jgi:hypothetical protein